MKSQMSFSHYVKSVGGVRKRKQVYVGMSGGVDSSVTAALLKRAGFQVVGVFIKVWQPDFVECTWKEDRLDAMRVAAKLGIDFKTIDLEKEYKKKVIDYMIREYEVGRTPNPDVYCNKYIKFGAFYDWAIKNGARYVATGHYARIAKDGDEYCMLAGVDKEKDQSYFLWQIKNSQLKNILFPVGEFKKSEVRKMAKEFRLANAKKKDSQGLCFVGKIDMADFLKKIIKTKKGKVLDREGRIIGEHDGSVLYTIGQRHGFRITKKTPNDRRFYVIAKDIKKNTITVSNKMVSEKVNSKEIEVKNLNWTSGISPKRGEKIAGRIRYRQKIFNCKIESISKTKLTIQTDMNVPSVALGQSLVLYKRFTRNHEYGGGRALYREAGIGSIVLGGGIIV